MISMRKGSEVVMFSLLIIYYFINSFNFLVKVKIFIYLLHLAKYVALRDPLFLSYANPRDDTSISLAGLILVP